MTLTYKFDLDSFEVNNAIKYLHTGAYTGCGNDDQNLHINLSRSCRAAIGFEDYQPKKKFI